MLNISSTFLRKVQELERANASKDRLFSIIGHDLRNPAAALQHVAGLISYYSKKGTPEQLINTSNHIVKAAKTLNEILDNLLSWSVTQTGDLKMQPLKISLPLLVKEAVDIFQDTAVSKDIRLDVHAPTELMVIADRNAILTILRNLLSNALKFTRPGGVVAISLYQREDTAQMIIQDNGIGIMPESIPDLFNLKENKSTPGTAKEKGIGLGLVLVSEMIRLNGARYRFLAYLEKALQYLSVYLFPSNLSIPLAPSGYLFTSF